MMKLQSSTGLRIVSIVQKIKEIILVMTKGIEEFKGIVLRLMFVLTEDLYRLCREEIPWISTICSECAHLYGCKLQLLTAFS